MAASDATPGPSAGSGEPEATGVYNPLDTASELVRVLDQYLADLHAGKAPDKARLMAENPDLARQLEDCLAGIEFVDRAAKSPTGTPARLGDFRIIREVGRGGMGVVYEAEQLSLKRKVALKVLRFGVTADAEVMQRFQREAETVAHLHHTNIVPIHAIGCEEGVQYYAMQFIEGRSLAAVADEAAPQSSGMGLERFHEIAGWILQGAEALAHAHQRGVIHRDIKPSNLILDPEGTVWLTDFGLAKRADEVTMTAAGILMGTPRYMSPEQAGAARQPIDHRTDIYSLGATLYELATGKPVFESQTPQGVITQILNAEPVAPRLVQGRLPRDLETVILKCLAKEPARRYQQARDLADDLRAFLENRAIKARRASLWERGVRWARKHQRSTAVSAVTAAISLLVIVGSFAGWGAYRESQMGRLVLTTDGPSLVAEVLDDRDEVVIPSFPVPAPQPVALPAGSYRVRLSASGQLSETWNVDVERGADHSRPVKLFERLLWPPLEVLSRDPPAFIELNGQTHLLAGGERGWRVVNGATARPLWPSDLKLPDMPMAPTDPQTLVNQEEWRNLLEGYSDMGSYHSPSTGQSPGLARPAVDLDNDGRHDLVFASRISPSLVAVSAKDGSALWWYRARPDLPVEHDIIQDPLNLQSSHESGGVIGEPLIAGTREEPVIVALLASISGFLQTKAGKEFRTGNHYRVEAVSVRTGTSLWRSAIAVPGLDQNYSDAIKQFGNPEIVRLEDRATLLVYVSTTLLAIDMENGTERWRYDLGSRPLQAPHIGDLDGDGQPEALFLYRRGQETDELMLRAVTLSSRATLWERSFLRPGFLGRNEWHTAGAELVLVDDLNGDGKPEVIIPVRDDWGKWGKHWFGVEVLNGATGAPRWDRRLWSMGTGMRSGSGGGTPLRLLAGADLDGDGHRELFAASFGSIGQPPEVGINYLQVDALSGTDGRTLWRWRQKVAATENPFEDGRRGYSTRLQWWQAGDDGWPQLVVPFSPAEGQPMTYVLAAGSGQVTHLLSEASSPQVADLNSDGVADLYYLAASGGNRRLTVLKGLPPVAWRRPGEWQLGGDYDGDGIADFREWGTDNGYEKFLAARSGANGRILWRTQAQPNTNPMSHQRTIDPDVDGDGTPDVVLLEWISDPGGGRGAVTALSGRDGQRLWSAADFGLQQGSTGASGGGPQREYSYPMLDQCDLDGDGRPEILVAAHIRYPNTISLAALSNKDGRLLWEIPIERGAYTGRSLIDRHTWHDLNGDRVLDIVLWVPKTINEHGVGIGFQLQAYSGRDGKPLWPEADREGLGWLLWPRPAIADLDGDGAPEVVITSNDGKGYDQEKQGYHCELLVLDGRSGETRWRWPWFSGDLSLWPPLLLDLNGDGKRMICMGVAERGPTGQTNNIVLFDAQGNLRERIPVGWVNMATAWAALDVDGDGPEELLYASDGELRAYQCRERRHVWQRPMTAGWAGLEDYRSPRRDEPGTLVVWSDRTVSGLTAATGEVRWRCEVPRYDQYQFTAHLSFRENSSELPLVVSRDSRGTGTLAQRAWPTTADGKYAALVPRPIDYPEYVDPIRFRRLPWQRDLSHFNPRNWFREPPVKMFLALSELPLVLIVPGMFIWLSFKGKGRLAIAYLLLFVFVVVANGALMIAVHSRSFEPDERYSWEGWYWSLYVGAIAMGFLTVVTGIVVWLVRRVRRLVVGTAKGG